MATAPGDLDARRAPTRRTGRTVGLVAAAVVAILAITTVFGGDGVTADDLRTRHFRVTAVEGRPLPPQTELRLWFTRDALGFSGGCNRIGGRYHLDQGSLWLETASGTDVLCNRSRMVVDGWMIDFLQSGPELTLAGDDLVLTRDGVTIRAEDTGDRMGTDPLP